METELSEVTTESNLIFEYAEFKEYKYFIGYDKAYILGDGIAYGTPQEGDYMTTHHEPDQEIELQLNLNFNDDDLTDIELEWESDD